MTLSKRIFVILVMGLAIAVFGKTLHAKDSFAKGELIRSAGWVAVPGTTGGSAIAVSSDFYEGEDPATLVLETVSFGRVNALGYRFVEPGMPKECDGTNGDRMRISLNSGYVTGYRWCASDGKLVFNTIVVLGEEAVKINEAIYAAINGGTIKLGGARFTTRNFSHLSKPVVNEYNAKYGNK